MAESPVKENKEVAFNEFYTEVLLALQDQI